MSQGTIRPSTLGIAGAYFFMSVLVFWPLVDLTTTFWPPQPGSLQWRYGFMGLMASYLHTPILAILLAMGLAYVREQPGALRFLSVLSLLGALVLLLVVILFPLDVIQLRASTEEGRLGSFQAGALLAELKHLTALVSLILLGWGAWRTARDLSRRTRSSEGSKLTAEVLKAQKKD